MGNTRWFEGGKKEPEYVVVEECGSRDGVFKLAN